MQKKSATYRNNVTVSDAFYTMRILLGVVISLLITITCIINYFDKHTVILLVTSVIAVIVCIALVIRFLWCYIVLQKGKHVGKE